MGMNVQEKEGYYIKLMLKPSAEGNCALLCITQRMDFKGHF